MLRTHSATPTLLVSFDQSNLLDISLHHSFIMWNSVISVTASFIFSVESFCDEIDTILNNPIVTTLLDNDIVLMIETL